MAISAIGKLPAGAAQNKKFASAALALKPAKVGGAAIPPAGGSQQPSPGSGGVPPPVNSGSNKLGGALGTQAFKVGPSLATPAPGKSVGPGAALPGSEKAGGSVFGGGNIGPIERNPGAVQEDIKQGSAGQDAGNIGFQQSQGQVIAEREAAEAEAAKSPMDKMYESMMQQAKDQWGITEQLNQSSAALMQRKSAAMQGAMGRSVAGGFAGAMGGAYIQGVNQMNQARLQHEQALQSLQLSYMGNKQREDWREEDISRQDKYRTEDQQREDYRRKEDQISQMTPEDQLKMMVQKSPEAAAAWDKLVRDAGGERDYTSQLRALIAMGFNPVDIL